ncbi:hypothetical protein BDN72DRAFT_832697 [Pluteus cervinus]|uniref:Uncharacterized protein n=1 Tax=Pluteus cervinus TaxID=181527 RepID=A0ACD3BB97_9AGAR|nr:hypothetical protein BDN72DRAFT_832697 [Pluteus cervinus]
MQALNVASGIQESSPYDNFKPRASLQGITLPDSFQLPDLKSVREQALRIPEAIDAPLERFKNVMLPDKHHRATALDDPTRPVVCHLMLYNLFRWSYFIHSSDVPEDLLEPRIFSLKMFLRFLEESPEEVIRGMGYYPPGEDSAVAHYAITANCRRKIIGALMDPKINRPAEAVPFLKKSVEAETKKPVEEGFQAWMVNPILFETYGEALMATDLHEAKLQLERALAGAEGPHGMVIQYIILAIFKIRVNLVAVLSQLGEDVQKRKSHEEWAVKYLRKNPFCMPDDLLRLLLLRKGFPEHPVLTILGGPKWFDKRKTTYKNQERRTKMCRNCGQREPGKTLSICAGCKESWYCSKECQVQHWKAHRAACKEMAAELKRLESLKLADPSAGERDEDWIKWRTSYLGIPPDTTMHALGVHRDPNRGFTHIVWYGVKYTPNAGKDIAQKFTIVLAGVFKVADVLPEIETCMNLNKGDGQQCIDQTLGQVTTFNQKVGEQRTPYLYMLLCVDGHTGVWLGNGSISPDYLRYVKYNPDWRKSIKNPPGPMIFVRPGIVDQEHIF